MGLFSRKKTLTDGHATVTAEMPGHGQMGDTKHGRYYWQKDELQLRVEAEGLLPHDVRWKGWVPRQIVGTLQGNALPVKVDPAKPEKLEFDWDGIVAAGVPSLPMGGGMSAPSVQLGSGRVVIGSDVQPTGDLADELEKIARLREQGVLSDEEFERAKRKLLAQD